MALIKNEIPILEYDTSEQAVLAPENKLYCHTSKKAVQIMEQVIAGGA